MPHLPFIKSVIPCVNPQVVGRVRPPPVAEHLLRLVSLQISSAKSGHGQSSLPPSLPAAGGGHPCGKVRAAHVAGLQPLRRRAEIRYQPLSPTLYHALCPAEGRAGGLRGGVRRNHLALPQSEPQFVSWSRESDYLCKCSVIQFQQLQPCDR